MKIKLRENNKATVKFDSATHKAQERQWFINLMRSIRDGDPKTHPAISIKDKNGEIPRLPKPKMPPLKPMPVKPEQVKPIPPVADLLAPPPVAIPVAPSSLIRKAPPRKTGGKK